MVNSKSLAIRLVTVRGLHSLAQLISRGVSDRLGRPVAVDEYPEAEAIDVAARSAPDGTTMLLFAQLLWTGPLLEKTSYDVLKDFAPITLVSTAPLIVVVHPSVTATTMKAWIEMAKAKPGELTCGSGLNGSSSQFGAALLAHMAGINIVRIAYEKGGPVGLDDLTAGKIQMMMPSAISALPLIKSGKVRALAVTSAKRSVLAPELPTVAESGVPVYEVLQTIGLFAPINTPAESTDYLNKAVVGYLQTDGAKAAMLNAGLEPVGSTPEQLTAAIKADLENWSRVLREVKIASSGA